MARYLRQSGVSSCGQSEACCRAARNSVSTRVLSLASMILASILAISRALRLVARIFWRSILRTESYDWAAILRWVWLVLLSWTSTFSFSRAMRYYTLILSISSTFFSIFLGIAGLVVLIDRIQIPGAHALSSELSERISSQSSRSNSSMQISCSVCLLQNSFISWCTLSVIQICQYWSVQLRTVLQTWRLSRRLMTSMRSKTTSRPLEVPQGTSLTISV